MNKVHIARLEQFTMLHPSLVRGVGRINFHSDHIELVWLKYDHTAEELQMLASQHAHLEWSIVRSDAGSRNLDWLCDFGDVLVRLQYADVEKIPSLPNTVNFAKLRQNEPELQAREDVCQQ